MKNYRQLIKLLIPYKKALYVGAVCLIIASLTNLAVPLYIKKLVDVVMVEKNMALMNEFTLNIAGLFLLQLIFSTAHYLSLIHI